jgi:hypothetical protein
VYQATVALETAPNGWISAWEDDARMTRAADLAACDSTAGSYYPSAESGATITLYVHATGNGNPASNGKTYEYSARWGGLFARSATGLRVDGIKTQRNYQNDGSLVLGPFAEAHDCVAADGSKHNVLCDRGSALYDVVADESYYGGQPSTMFVYNTDVANGEDVLFERCEASNSAMVVDAYGFYGHKNDSGEFGTVTFRDCVVENCGLAFDAAHVGTVVIDGATTSGCKLILRPSGAGVGTWDVGGITHVGGGDPPNNDPLLRFETTDVVDLHDCDIEPAYSTAETVWVSAACTLTIRDSVFACADTTGWPIFMQCSAGADGATLNFQRNRYERYRAWLYYLPADVTVTSDYNTFAAESDNFHLDGTTYNGLAAWQAAGYDAHSTAE